MLIDEYSPPRWETILHSKPFASMRWEEKQFVAECQKLGLVSYFLLCNQVPSVSITCSCHSNRKLQVTVYIFVWNATVIMKAIYYYSLHQETD